jgi:hypothetical protein
MTEMTPESLRQTILWASSVNGSAIIPEHILYEHVSAWKADREQLRLAIVDQANTEAELNETRQISRRNGDSVALEAEVMRWESLYGLFPGGPAVDYAPMQAHIEALEKRLKQAAEDAWKSEVLDTDMLSLLIGPNEEYANKQEWLEDWLGKEFAALAKEKP